MDAFSPGAHIVKLGPTRRYVLRTLAVIAVGVVLLFTVPTHHNVTAQAVVGAAKTEAISPSVGGMIQEVYVKTGQRVKAGDPIARIENPSVDAELAQRQADWERARLRFSALQADSSWKSLELMPEVAKAMDQARTEVQRVQADYDRLILRASIDGVVWGRNLEQLIGQYADTSGVLLRIADPSTLRLLIAVPEEKAEVIEVGNPVKGRWRADGRAFETTVRDVPRQPASLREYTAGMLSVFGGAAPLTAQTHANQMPDYPIYLIEAHLAGVPEQLTVEGMRAQVTIEGRQTTYASRLGRWFMRLLGFKKTRV